ncbi:MAG TPA: response regulator transcription factor [Candidatus Binatia bacterium]|nr:response regulator transcription factor [Candidatus Binatia bacterium]
MGSPTLLPIRILIIDDHVMVRTALRTFLDNWPKFRVVGEAAGSNEALALAAREQPDVILLDLDLGDTSGLDLLPELLVAASAARVLILTGVYDPDLHCQAVSLGAMGLVLKGKSIDILLQAIEKVHIGEVWLEPAMVATVLSKLAHPRGGRQKSSEEVKIATLTPREREVIALVGKGLRNRQIAQRLCISETTVRHHLSSIFSKLEVAERLELVIYAYRHGLAKMPH